MSNYTIRKHIIFLKKSIDENNFYTNRQDMETEKLRMNLVRLKDMFESLKKSVLNKDKLIYEKVVVAWLVRISFFFSSFSKSRIRCGGSCGIGEVLLDRYGEYAEMEVVLIRVLNLIWIYFELTERIIIFEFNFVLIFL